MFNLIKYILDFLLIFRYKTYREKMASIEKEVMALENIEKGGILNTSLLYFNLYFRCLYCVKEEFIDRPVSLTLEKPLILESKETGEHFICLELEIGFN